MKITKLIFVSLILILNIGAPSIAFAEDSRVILDQLLTGDVPQLNASDIKIPDDLKPGYHELQVEVLDDVGVVSSKTALFCKDLAGELHFDNNCPDLLVTSQQKVFRSSLKPYDPTSDPVGTASLAFVAFAVASSLLVSGANRYSENPATNEDSDEESMGDLGSVSAAKLATRSKDLAWGDRAWYINKAFFNSLDDFANATARGVSRFSSLLGRAVLDARYLRAIFGNFAWLTIAGALIVSFIGLNQIDNQALPYELIPLIALMCVGVFDALAGFFGAFLYLNFIFANGNFDSTEALFTGLGVSLIFFAPGLIASKFRPLTRSVRDFTTFWERGTDYVLASLLTGWSVSKLVAALPGLSKLDLPIVEHASQIGVIAGVSVAARLLLEEIAWYAYPLRLAKLTTPLKKAGLLQDFRGILFKTAVFYLLAEPFIGFNKYLLAGCGIFIIPQLLGLISDKLPKSAILDQINPRGAFKIVLLSLISVFAVNYLKTLDLSPADFILTSFVFLPLPALFFILLDAFSGERKIDITKHPKFRYFYRIFGVVTLGLLVLIVLGKDPFAEIKAFFERTPDYWRSFVDQIQIWSNWLVDHAVSSWNWLVDHAVLSWNWLSDFSVVAWDWIGSAAVNTWHWLSEQSVIAWDWISENVSKGVNWLVDAINSGWKNLRGLSIN
jgi:hypothetical protein